MISRELALPEQALAERERKDGDDTVLRSPVTVGRYTDVLGHQERLPTFNLKNYLHPDVRDFFLFRYNGRFYRCVALLFGWGRSVLWFTKLLRPLVQFIR